MSGSNSFVFGCNILTFSRKAAKVLKQGLERTLSQIRHLVGTIEKDGDGYHSIVKRRTSTVSFVIQHLDAETFPSFAQIEACHFTAAAVGDTKIVSNASMTHGTKPEAHPDRSPPLSAFKASFIPGGLILNVQTHHYTNGISGWAAFVRQLAANCYAIAHGTEGPSFDQRCLDRSLFGSLGFERPPPSTSKKVCDPRPRPTTEHMPSQMLLFHLPKSKAAELKKAATSSAGWVSTYSAMCALMWRVFSRIREPVLKPSRSDKPVFGTGVNVGKQFSSSSMPKDMQGNMQFDIMSTMSALPQLTVAEVVSEAPLSKLALYIRQLIDGVTTEMLADVLEQFTLMRASQDISISVEAFPPLALYVTDWREAELCTFDFGFAKPAGFRHLFEEVPTSLAVVYAPRSGGGEDEGVELQIPFEKDLVQQLINDPEWSSYFEFRGVDMWGKTMARL